MPPIRAQQRLLAALLRREGEILANGTEDEKAEVRAYGVPWRLTAIIGRSPTRSESASASRSIRRLQDAGLVCLCRYEGEHNVVNVKLLDAGRAALKENHAL